jgi:hypothetical protein
MISKKHDLNEAQIKEAYKKAGSIRGAAKLLGVPRETLRDWVLKIKSSDKKVKKAIPLEHAEPDSTLKLSKRRKARYVVTCAQNNTEIHKDFYKAIQNYCRVNNAQLLVVPMRYKNVTAFIEEEDSTVWWPSELQPYYLNEEYHINDNLVILGNLKVQATSTNPLSGIGAIAKTKSALVGHAQLQMRMIPTPLTELPRQLLTTASISLKNYSKSKAGHIAAYHHTIGAVIVEVDGDIFWTRTIEANEDDGSFCDLDKFYSTNEVHPSNVSGVRFGDIHNDFLDPDVKKALWMAPDSLVKVLKPEHQFLDDALDFYSANHHHRGNIFTQFAKSMSGMGNVEHELLRLVETHNNIWSDPDVYYHYISSNHNDALTRWLKEADPKEDPENALIYHKLMVYMLEHTKMTPNGTSIPNPLEYFMKERIKNPDKTFFHSRDSKVLLQEIDMSQHGDRGPNGSFGTMKAFANSGYKVTIGHLHTPGMEKGCNQTGTCSRLKLEYVSGYSSWAHTQEIIYQNGARTLITVVKGRWRLADV